MLIGIDGSRAFLKNRTGIEEYSYQVIEGLRDELKSHQVVLYIRAGQRIDFDLPKNWKTTVIKWPYLWTQLGLSLEMLLNPVDTLFVPAHTIPIIHPKKTLVTIHGLEYEFCGNSYSFLDRLYMRWTIRKSCQWASKIIAVSENTKKDLTKLYEVPAEKITVVYEGYANQPEAGRDKLKVKVEEYKPFLLFIGRLEERKNIIGIIDTFETLKENYKIPHKLILAGKPGFGYERIRDRLQNANCRQEIIELGFVSEQEKWELLKSAAVFVFPTLYEGFGIPLLEAQSVGCPVVTSNKSSIPEVADGSALLVDPANCEEIAESIHKLISNEEVKNDIIRKGYENVKRFSWDKCASQISSIMQANE